MPVVYANDAEDPTARSADGGDFDDCLIEGLWGELVALVPLGLDAAKDPGLPKVVEGFLWQAPQFFGMRRAFAQYRQQCPNSAEIFFRRHNRTPKRNALAQSTQRMRKGRKAVHSSRPPRSLGDLCVKWLFQLAERALE